MKLKYNSLKKIGILTLSVAMLTGNFLPTVGHAQVEPVSTETVTENTMDGCQFLKLQLLKDKG
ncbi:hypothetical protein [Niallia taxi]|uniref:hypothetical protein n=1 Tax=Niallia taxi TaxID=2499688 RepID=UPI003D2C0031